MILDPVSRSIVKWSLIGVAVCVLLLVTYSKGGQSEREAHQATKQAHAETLRTLADRAKRAEVLAAEASRVVALARTAADNKLKEAQADAKREADGLRADLRAGRVRLQDRWACPVRGAGPGGDPAGTGEADAAGRHDSLARVHAAVASDAAVIDWLWSSWMADRKAVIDGGCAVVGQ